MDICKESIIEWETDNTVKPETAFLRTLHTLTYHPRALISPEQVSNILSKVQPKQVLSLKAVYILYVAIGWIWIWVGLQNDNQWQNKIDYLTRNMETRKDESNAEPNIFVHICKESIKEEKDNTFLKSLHILVHHHGLNRVITFCQKTNPQHNVLNMKLFPMFSDRYILCFGALLEAALQEKRGTARNSQETGKRWENSHRKQKCAMKILNTGSKKD